MENLTKLELAVKRELTASGLQEIWQARDPALRYSARMLVEKCWKGTMFPYPVLFQWAIFEYINDVLPGENACVYFNWGEGCRRHDHRLPSQSFRHHCVVCGASSHAAIGVLNDQHDNECKKLTDLRKQLQEIAKACHISQNKLYKLLGFMPYATLL